MADLSTSTSSGSETDLRHYNGPAAVVKRWLKELTLVQEARRQKAFEAIGERIVQKFRNAQAVDNYSSTGRAGGKVMFNVLWSNTQVLEPALYSRMPKPVVERTFKDSDPMGRLAAEVAERALTYQLQRQQERFNYVMRAVVQDRLLPGRGQACVHYKADFEDATDENGEPIVDEETGEAIRKPKPNSERAEVNYIHWQDYLESTARTQYEVRWRAYRIYMTRSELIKEFGSDVGGRVELSVAKGGKRKKSEEEQEFLQQAEIWVVYDFPSKQVLWICEGYQEGPLKQLENPLGLREFWNCPLPLVATTTTDSTYPTPDYVIYEGLADELDYVTKRIKAITECIRLVGVTAAAFAEKLTNITSLPDGKLQPMENFPMFQDKGGLRGVIDWVPFDQCVNALPVLTGYQQSLKAQVDEITSMPDIVRGSSDPNDPVYTQQQKSHWTVIKLVRKQQDVQRFCAELVAKMAEITFEPGLFSDETIALMAGVAQMTPEKQAMFPEALALLRDDRLATFRVSIETDSTIAIDEEQAMSRWMQYLQGLREIVGNVEAVSQYRPELMGPMVESALSAVRQLRTGRSVEGAWEKAFDQIEEADKAARENPPPPPPDYEAMKAENESAKTQVAQMQAQTEAAKLQIEQMNAEFTQWEKSQRLQLETMKLEGELALKAQANEIAAGQAISRAEIDKLSTEIKAFSERFKHAIASEELQFKKESKSVEMAEKIMEEQRLARQDDIEIRHQDTMREVAHIKAKATPKQKPAPK
jgi:hypothetical protein